MAIITDHGIESESLPAWVRKYQEAFRTVFGDDVALDESTAIGRIIATQASIGNEIDSLIVYVAAGDNLYQATGRQLTDYATWIGIPFNEGTRSTVTVTLTGTEGTIVPEGTRIQTSAGATFQTTEDALIPASLSVNVLCQATTLGPVQAPANTLTQIVDVISGLSTVLNDEAADVGRNAESDADWVARYTSQVAVHGQGTNENIAARIANLPGVERVRVFDNPERQQVTARGFTQAANSVSVIVSGTATAAAITAAIRATKTPGIPMNGDQTHVISGVTYRYTEAAETAIAVNIETTISLGEFPANGRETIRTNLINFVESLHIGSNLDLARLRAVLAEVPGHTLDEFDVTLANGDTLTPTTEATLWTLESDDITIDLETS